ncbi:MAG: molybdopterin adenylyltransferase [Acidobacteriaceae bacterium]
MSLGYTAAVLTVSDSCARGEREDTSGASVVAALRGAGYDVVRHSVVVDEVEKIAAELEAARDEGARFIVTTGGTGISARDVTPEATAKFCERLLPGVGELMRSEGRAQTAMAVLSRGVCGTRGTSVVLNLPGSPTGASKSLEVVLPLIPHALQLLDGETEHRDPH